MRRAQRIATIAARAASSSSGAVAVASVLVPGSDAFPFDLHHARRGLVGGTLARAWIAVTVASTTRLYSIRQNGSAADPTVHVPAYVGIDHRYVDLGSSSASAADVVAALVAALALDGIAASDDGAGADGRRVLAIPGATITVPAAVALDRRERGMFGLQRDDWGAGVVTGNADGGTNGTGSVHVGNPSSQPGMSGRAGRVLGVYLWAHTGHAPRLAAFTGPVYSTSPTALTTLGQAVADAISGFGGVLFDAAAFSSSAELWATYRENAGGGPRYRLHGETPVGRGDLGVGEQLVWDTSSSAASSSAFGSSYSPTADATFPIYVAIGVIFELQDASGNYPADGSIDEWIGDQNLDPTHGTQFAADQTFLTGETTHHRHVWPAWTNHRATAFRRVYSVAGADETSRIAMYGPWASLAFPASPAPALLADLGTMGVLTPGAYSTLTYATPVELETPTAGGQHLSVGANYVRAGGPLATLTLPVFLDVAIGDGSWLDCWVDDRATWHDDIPGASGSRALPSGQSEYRTRSATGMPISSPTDTYPATLITDATDDSPIALALEASRVERPGFALV